MVQRDPPDNDPVNSVIHDLQNVLTVIRAQAQLIQRRLDRDEPPSPDRLAARMKVIDEATHRMALMIGRLSNADRRPAPSDDGPERPSPHRPPDND